MSLKRYVPPFPVTVLISVPESAFLSVKVTPSSGREWTSVSFPARAPPDDWANKAPAAKAIDARTASVSQARLLRRPLTRSCRRPLGSLTVHLPAEPACWWVPVRSDLIASTAPSAYWPVRPATDAPFRPPSDPKEEVAVILVSKREGGKHRPQSGDGAHNRFPAPLGVPLCSLNLPTRCPAANPRRHP
jgi:hypothetical protein